MCGEAECVNLLRACHSNTIAKSEASLGSLAKILHKHYSATFSLAFLLKCHTCLSRNVENAIRSVTASGALHSIF
jgi:hypothetical protein